VVPLSILSNGYQDVFLGVMRPKCEAAIHVHPVPRLGRSAWNFDSMWLMLIFVHRYNFTIFLLRVVFGVTDGKY
jgi:hypothetical protein